MEQPDSFVCEWKEKILHYVKETVVKLHRSKEGKMFQRARLCSAVPNLYLSVSDNPMESAILRKDKNIKGSNVAPKI